MTWRGSRYIIFFQEDFNVWEMEFLLKMMNKKKLHQFTRFKVITLWCEKIQYILVKIIKREYGLICAVIDAVSRQIDYEMMSEFLHISMQSEKKSEINIKTQLNGDAVGNAEGANNV